MDAVPMQYPAGRELSDLALKNYLSSHDVLQDFLDIVVKKMDSEIGFFHFCDEAKGELDLKVWSGTALEQGPALHDCHYHPLPSEVWTKCISTRLPEMENDSNQTCLVARSATTEFKVKNYISFPIMSDNRIIAVLGVGNRVSPYDVDDLEKLTDYVKTGWPIIIDIMKVRKEGAKIHSSAFLAQSHENILEAMAQAFGKALELRDEYTNHHQSNVSQITRAIACQLGLSDERSFGLNIGSLIHDIGKIIIPSQLLNKTGKLLPAEMEIIKLHASYGKEMFVHLSLPWPIADMIGQHHERMDGSGYPSGAKGSSICLEARIIAVADTFDAMAGDRPYRHAPGKEKALSTLVDGRMTAYDPYVVDAFIDVLNSDTEIEQLYA